MSVLIEHSRIPARMDPIPTRANIAALVAPFTAALLATTGCAPEAGEPAEAGARAAAPDLSAYELVDLTHPLGPDALFWPGSSPPTFQYERLHHDWTDEGFFYSAGAFSTPEHGGTHVDAPIHFAEGRQTVDEIPLERLVAPALVIDVTEQSAADRDYRLTREDVLAWEARYGEVPEGAIVLLHTGWSRYWPDASRYFGDDTPGDASNFSFPSYGEEAARLLVEERRVAALGADVASIDYGRSTDFMVHRIAAESNVPGLENLTNLDRLPPTGAIVIALPILIEGGSGGPARVVALVP